MFIIKKDIQNLEKALEFLSTTNHIALLTFNNLHPDLRLVGELLPQGYDLLWRRRARLYMEVPHEWPVPDEFLDCMKDGRIKLYGKFRTFQGKLIRSDRYKAWLQIDHYYASMQELYWKALFSKGIILAVESYKIDEYTLVSFEFQPLPVRMLVPKSLPHKVPEKSDMENPLLVSLLFGKTDIKYYPADPLSLDDYDDFPIGFTNQYDLSQSIFVDNFESARKTIADILCPGV